MLSGLRAVLGPLRRSVAEPIARTGIHPDTFSLLAIPLSVGAAALLLTGWGMPGFVLACLASLVDFFDGDVARLQERVTPFGSLFDATIDRFVDAALLVGLVGRWPVLAATALALGALAPYVKARVGLVMVSDNRDWPGVGDRSDRVVLALLAIFLSLFVPSLVPPVLWLLIGISALGAVQRVQHARTLIAEAERDGRLIG